MKTSTYAAFLFALAIGSWGAADEPKEVEASSTYEDWTNLKVHDLPEWYKKKKAERLVDIEMIRKRIEAEEDEEAKKELESQVKTLLSAQFMPPLLDFRTMKVGDVGIPISFGKDTDVAGEAYYQMLFHEYVTMDRKRVARCEFKVQVDKKLVDSGWFIWTGDGKAPNFVRLEPPYEWSNSFYPYDDRHILAIVKGFRTIKDGSGKTMRAAVLSEFKSSARVPIRLPETTVE